MIKNNSNYTIVLKHTDSISNPTRCILKNLYCKCTYCSVWKCDWIAPPLWKREISWNSSLFYSFSMGKMHSTSISEQGLWKIRVKKTQSFPKRYETVTAWKNLTSPFSDRRLYEIILPKHELTPFKSDFWWNYKQERWNIK